MSDKKWYFNMVTGEPELGPALSDRQAHGALRKP